MNHMMISTKKNWILYQLFFSMYRWTRRHWQSGWNLVQGPCRSSRRAACRGSWLIVPFTADSKCNSSIFFVVPRYLLELLYHRIYFVIVCVLASLFQWSPPTSVGLTATSLIRVLNVGITWKAQAWAAFLALLLYRLCNLLPKIKSSRLLGYYIDILWERCLSFVRRAK